MSVNLLKHEAEKAKIEYKQRLINREEAKERIHPYVEAFNKKSKEIAKKYHQKPKLLSVSSYLR
ncbi:hypothetical protein ACQKCU_23910 [Heyndrickxia sporothermodurans]